MSYQAHVWCTLVLGINIAIVHALLGAYELYWYLPWVDIPMHFLGGVWLICVLGTLGYLRIVPLRWSQHLQSAFLVTLIIMVGWEVFGIWLEQGFKVGWLIDTTGDLVFGILGAMVGYWRLNTHTHA